MNDVLTLGLAWLLLSVPFAVFVSKCIGEGQSGELARDAADECPSTAAEPVPGVPAQRRPAAAVRQADLIR